MSLDCRRKPEYPESSYAETGRTCEFYTGEHQTQILNICFRFSSDVQQCGLHLQGEQKLQFYTVHLLSVAFLIDCIRGVGYSVSC